MRYDPEYIQPLRDELTKIGFKELTTPDAVDAVVHREQGTTMVVINSVCGCAAGKVRPGVGIALKESTLKPDRLATVFAGGDVEATARLRTLLGDLPPSSPSIAFFKDGRLVQFVPRHQLEWRDPDEIAELLKESFSEYCSTQTAAS